VEGPGTVIFGINALSLTPGQSGGSETYVRELVTHLARIDPDNEYRLFVGAARREFLRADAPNFRTIAFPLPHGAAGPRFMAEQLWLPAAARRAGIHALLCPMATIPRLLSPPAVIIVHDRLSFCPEFWPPAGGFFGRWSSRFRERYYRLSLRRSARRAAAVLAISDPIRREIVRFFAIDPARVPVARHGVSSRFRPVEAPERIAGLLERHGLRAPFVVLVSTLSPYKNLDRVLEGLALVRRWSHRLPMLALVGNDRFDCRPGLERLAGGLDLQEHVRFLGPLPASDLPALYTAATASLSPSPGDSAGIPMIESMACGCPVIAARRSTTPEVAGEAALYVDPDRPQEIAEAIWRLATLPNIRDAWVARGLEHARQFDWHETARITRDALLAAGHGRPLRPAPEVTRPSPVEATGEDAATGEARN
jgi:glycosyltransferase involved in cell wall biosynthesis